MFIIRLLNVLLAGLMAGAVFSIAVGYNPRYLSVGAYVEQHQNAVNGLNTLLPLLGLFTILLTLGSAYLQRSDRMVLIPLIIAALFFITSGLVTRFGNQPINSIVMTWAKDSIPENWTELRAKWWSYHLIRTATTFVGFAIVSWKSIKN